jgi:hypothetical protein
VRKKPGISEGCVLNKASSMCSEIAGQSRFQQFLGWMQNGSLQKVKI